MFAKYLYLEDEFVDWDEGPDAEGKDLTQIQDVRDALSRLDGDRHSILIVAEGRPIPESGLPYYGKALVVSGGENDQFLVEAEGFHGTTGIPFTVRNSSVPDTDECVELKRGEEESFPKQYIVNRNTAREALDVFVKTGELNPHLDWEVRKGFNLQED